MQAVWPFRLAIRDAFVLSVSLFFKVSPLPCVTNMFIPTMWWVARVVEELPPLSRSSQP
jgi:hypothetical protein